MRDSIGSSLTPRGSDDEKEKQCRKDSSRLLSDKGPCYVSGELSDYLEANNMTHTRGRPCHPQTQGKIER
ncbi:MAG TPA: transposase [Gammaproteobacteria bacterium]|nr:transposase [Gammaproteobacteria bacterium]